MSRYFPGVFFAVFWTAIMLWWNAPLDTAEIVIFVVCGILAGAAFGWAMNWFADRVLRKG